jgi:hypothetical protein
MKHVSRIALVVLLVVAPQGAHAQWLHYPTPGVPRKADGTPNLTARAPNGADGKPDLSGVWQLEAPPCNDGCDYPAAPEFLNLGAKLPDGLPYQPWAAELVKTRRAAFGRDDPVAFCRPAGAVRLLTFPPFRKFLQLPGLFVILSERDVTFRQIFLDGRPLPNDPSPTPNGYSTGRWDGDTLVVETNGLREGTWLDRGGSPISDAARMTECYRRVDYGHLTIDLTIDDPKTYMKPWTVRLTQTIVVDGDLLDYHCTDNERDAARVTAPAAP